MLIYDNNSEDGEGRTGAIPIGNRFSEIRPALESLPVAPRRAGNEPSRARLGSARLGSVRLGA
jgi:hypothetical protein